MKRAWLWLSLGGAAAHVLGCGETPGATTVEPGHSGAGMGAAASHAGAAQAGSAQAGSAQAGSANTHGGTRAEGGNPNDAGASGATTASGGAGPDNACAAADLDGLSVFSNGRWDSLGYPPYALDGCTLVYVAPADGGGALHVRNLATGDDLELEPAASKPSRPTVARELIAWEIGEGTASQVRVSYQGRTRTLSGSFEHAGEPRATADALVFTAFLGPAATDDSDVYLYDAASDQLSKVASGPGQQRFADVSPTHVVVTDFSEDPRGYFNEYDSVADVLVIDRQSGVATPRPRPGKQAFPLLGSDGALVYLDWGAVHPEPKFSQFGLRAGVLGAPLEADYDVKPNETIHTDPAYVRPSLHGQHVDFVDTKAGVIGLYRFTLGSSEAPIATPISGSSQLLGPVASDTMTLVSKLRDSQTFALTAVAR